MGSREQREMILAIALSALVILAWQLFYGQPALEKQRAERETQRQQTTVQAPGAGGTTAPVPQPGGGPGGPAAPASRAQIIAATPRLAIDTPALSGSINLKGGRLDDLRLKQYHETVSPQSPTITLLSPSGSGEPFYAEVGYVNAEGQQAKLPNAEAVWQAPPGAQLAPGKPVTLTWDNGEGLLFRRTIGVDDHYMFTVRQEVENRSGTAVSLHPFSLVSRHGTPATQGFYILHEGLFGVVGAEGLQEITYSDAKESKQPAAFDAVGGWAGITDKYWAVTVIPDQKSTVKTRFFDAPRGNLDIYQADFTVQSAVSVPPGGSTGYDSRIFAGAKVVEVVDGYFERLGIDRFDKLVDWGWFPYITKPLFLGLEYFKGLFGNFGVAILLVTVLVKLLFFPLANRSYAAMSEMKKLQPEMLKIRERFPDDRQKQQEAMMELYKREKVNPVSGCLPVLLQVPVFFALYKVLFVTIEMRHAPFYGWIRDLSAPDPTTLFNLFGLIPWEPPALLMVGAWPLIMGVTMWLQMRLNPAPPDPVQAQIFNWMPVFFTYLLASFPAGLVIYWAWNNLLSILQQWVIMKKHGVEVDILGNIQGSIGLNRKKPAADGTPGADRARDG